MENWCWHMYNCICIDMYVYLSVCLFISTYSVGILVVIVVVVVVVVVLLVVLLVMTSFSCQSSRLIRENESIAKCIHLTSMWLCFFILFFWLFYFILFSFLFFAQAPFGFDQLFIDKYKILLIIYKLSSYCTVPCISNYSSCIYTRKYTYITGFWVASMCILYLSRKTPVSPWFYTHRFTAPELNCKFALYSISKKKIYDVHF